ncbi:hypothetical protein [Reyranella sp.]|jgi:hypothetical protein|uniref:hypothetical protein n=1 Tax=Reyranella sp. TaxID=1929291 RepID=UPI002F930BF5
MRLASSTTTFADLDRAGRAVRVECQRCGHLETLDGDSAALAARRVSGARFRCVACGAFGLPTIVDKPRRLSTDRLARHARSVERPPRSKR